MLKIILIGLISAFRSHRRIALENIALRHQLEVLQRTAKRPPLRPSDRAIWSSLVPFRTGAITSPSFSQTPSSGGTGLAGDSTGVGEAALVEVGRRSLPRSEP